MEVSIVGTGYVGLISGVCLAAKGNHVTCVELNQSVVRNLNEAKPTIYEKGLAELLKNVVQSGHFRVTQNLDDALSRSDVAIIAVGTPSAAGMIDLNQIQLVSEQIGKCISTIDRPFSVIVKSTVIPGTTDTLIREWLEVNSGKKVGDFGLGMNPEFLREGNAIEDFMSPDRIVFGHDNILALQHLENLYRPWKVDKIRVNTRTAELIKYANNALLATQISAINEIANLASKIGGIDIMDVVSGVHLDKRWNPIINEKRVNPEILKYIIPGCGFGGSCFPKDVEALRSQGLTYGLSMKLLNSVLEINENQPHQVCEIIQTQIGDLSKKNVLLLGLSFKPETDDVRESPAIKISKYLLSKNVNVIAHDPISVNNFKKTLGSDASRINFTKKWQNVVDSVSVIIVITPWSEYQALYEFDLTNKIFFDSRRVFHKDKLIGARYCSIGFNSL